ncbi:Major Facilitator Superfamily protein [uncultured archaeon]|nr:Major Facilitator Superfamily protein [uncultured archaeon]
MDRSFLRLYTIQFFYIISHVFGWTLSSLYFVQIGYSFIDIAVYFAASFISSVLTVMALKHFHSNRLMRAGLILKFLVFATAAYLYVKPLLLFSEIMQGVMAIFWWVPMNIHFFRHKKEGRNASHSGLYFLMWPLVSTILPAVAGAAAEKYGMKTVFFSAAALILPAIVLSFRAKESSQININFKRFTEYTKGVKTLLFLQGIWEGVDWTVVPLATLSFVSAAAGFGAFYSYLGFFGIVAFFIAGRASDRIKKRAIFLYPVTVAMALSTILSGLSTTFLAWGVFRGAVSFLVNLFSPFSMTVVVDTSKSLEESMIAREFLLNFGRALGAMIVVLLLIMSVPIQHALVVSGAILLLHPLFLRHKKKGYRVEI